MRGSEWTQAVGVTATAMVIATRVGVVLVVLSGIAAGALLARCIMRGGA